MPQDSRIRKIAEAARIANPVTAAKINKVLVCTPRSYRRSPGADTAHPPRLCAEIFDVVPGNSARVTTPTLAGCPTNGLPLLPAQTQSAPALQRWSAA